MKRTSLRFDGVYCCKISSTTVDYMRFHKNGLVLERLMGPLEDAKFNTWDFGFILDKSLIEMNGSSRKGFGIGNSDMIMSGTCKVQKNKSVIIQVKDALKINNEYIGIPSEDGMDLVLVPQIMMGKPVPSTRQMHYKFHAFSS